MDPITKAFIAGMEQFAEQEKVPILTFEKGQRKDDVAAEYRKKFSAPGRSLVHRQGARENVRVPHRATAE
jgi:hypothetical protein